MIISPDSLRYGADGLYDSSREATNTAWDLALAQLAMALPSSGGLSLLVGIPGSGKSTWCAKNVHPDSSGIWFDATFTKRSQREPLIQMAAAAGKEVCAYVFLTPILTCIQRNQLRSPDRRVPYHVMSSMLENLRREPVTLDEGFQRITAIRPEM